MEKETYTPPKKKKKRKKWILFVILFLFLYVFWQAYLVNFNGVDTVKAVEGYLNDSIISQGIVCRDEVVLKYTSGGSVDYLVADGERVSKGALVANAYSSPQDVENLVYLRNREELLNNINMSAEYLNGASMDVSVARKQLANEIASLAKSNSVKDYSDTLENLNGIVLGLNKIAIATNRATNFDEAKASAERQISELKSQIHQPVERLYTPYTGYFISRADGYENVATADNFEKMSYEDGWNIISNNSSFSHESGEYGKIITDYKWNICTYIDTDKCENLYEGKNVSISISLRDNSFNKAVIKKMVNLGEKTLVVTQCSIMGADSASKRLCDCEILFRQYKGIKIPKTAIHFEKDEDGKNCMGVYVNYSNIVQFKKISPMYEDENYVIVPLTTSSDNQVKLYDLIIVKGRNLYDGKYL